MRKNVGKFILFLDHDGRFRTGKIIGIGKKREYLDKFSNQSVFEKPYIVSAEYSKKYVHPEWAQKIYTPEENEKPVTLKTRIL